MKLYTEEQVNELLRALRDIAQWDEDLEDDWEDAGNRAMDALRCFEKQTPIELPSDEEISTSLCYYDLRNADGISQFKEDKEHYGLNDDDFKDLGNFAKKDCGCDNCFYGTHKLANYILKIQGGNK